LEGNSLEEVEGKLRGESGEEQSELGKREME
jgi:hypothetical protein